MDVVKVTNLHKVAIEVYVDGVFRANYGEIRYVEGNLELNDYRTPDVHDLHLILVLCLK